ncbi:MAG TPA: ATP-binding cassette domain-containing protein, partial [Thermoguttaceae bacterium]
MSKSLQPMSCPSSAETQPVPASAPPHYHFVTDPRQPETFHETPLPGAAQDLIATGHLKAIGLYKSYRKGSAEVPVLRDLNIEIVRGEFLAIAGQSGSGKSTLLHLLGTLDAPDQGEIHFDGRRIDNLPAMDRDLLRNKRFGMIF